MRVCVCTCSIALTTWRVLGCVSEVLANTVPKCQQLRTLIVDDNGLGAVGAEAFVAALPQCIVLASLRLERCGLDAKAKQALRQVWANNGKQANLLYI